MAATVQVDFFLLLAYVRLESGYVPDKHITDLEVKGQRGKDILLSNLGSLSNVIAILTSRVCKIQNSTNSRQHFLFQHLFEIFRSKFCERPILQTLNSANYISVKIYYYLGNRLCLRKWLEAYFFKTSMNHLEMKVQILSTIRERKRSSFCSFRFYLFGISSLQFHSEKCLP